MARLVNTTVSGVSRVIDLARLVAGYGRRPYGTGPYGG